MWWSNSIALALMSLIFCTWMLIVQMPHIKSKDVITTNVEVSLIEQSDTNNVTKKKSHHNRNIDFEIRKSRKNKHVSIPQVMLDLYEKATAVRQNNPMGDGRFLPDVVKGLTPKSTASVLGSGLDLVEANSDRRHLLMFEIPGSNFGETLQSAELRLLFTVVRQNSGPTSPSESGVEHLVHVYVLEKKSKLLELDMQHIFQKHRDTWLSFNVTAAVKRPKTYTFLRLMVLIRAVSTSAQLDLALAMHQDVQPLLLLSYSTSHMDLPSPRIRVKRDAEDYEEESNNIWDDDRVPAGPGNQARRMRRQRNTCRRKPLYVDFSEIHYDTWIVAPNGYEAFQCSGKCFFPVSEHLSPTKHAIVQTLLHSIAPGKAPRACCVPTRLEPISVLYVDQRGVLTYRFSYQDMVVAECGCR